MFIIVKNSLDNMIDLYFTLCLKHFESVWLQWRFEISRIAQPNFESLPFSSINPEKDKYYL